jgi:hypothetical protein
MIEKILYLKFCWNRALSHLNIPLSVVSHIMTLAIFLKLFGLYSNTIVLLCTIGLSSSLLIVGHFDIKMGIAEKETSISNKYNPEIQRLLKR